MSKTPCIGCGWCCLDHLCMEALRLYGYQRRCPSLRWDDDAGRYVCDLMLDPEHEEQFKRANHEGEGCYAPLNEWRKDVRNRDND